MIRKAITVAVVVAGLALGAAADNKGTNKSPSVPELLSAGRVDDAMKALDVRLKSEPKDAEAYNLLSRSFFALQRWDDAISTSEKAVALRFR